MIDFFIKYDSKTVIENVASPFRCLEFYQKYIKYEKFQSWGALLYFSNSFEIDEHKNSVLETERHIFFLSGKVYYRNNISSSLKQREIPIEIVYRIFKTNDKFIEEIKGNFVFIVFDKNDKSIEITNSPFGVTPINYSKQGTTVFISTNLSAISRQLDSPSVNNAALVQLSLFDTILGDNTLIKQISQLQNGQRVTISGNNLEKQFYFKLDSLYSQNPTSRKESLKDLHRTLKTNMELIPTNEKILLGLTGGFDCRLNLSLIEESNFKNIVSYTYGMSASPEIQIAEKIANRYDLEYHKIILEEEYEKKYLNNANEVIQLGDGFTPFMRANYFYANNILSKISRKSLTGMFGSEFIKPLHILDGSVTINKETVNAFLSDKPIDSLVSYFRNSAISSNKYLRGTVFSESVMEECIQLINDQYLDKSYLSKEMILYNFHITEGIRKFFMEIFRIDKVFVEHYLPYLDIDFIELLFSSEYAGLYNNPYNESLIKRRKGQLLYVDVMNISKPYLNNIPVDRGYKPKYLTSNVGWIAISFGYIFGKKFRKLLKGNQTYNTIKWKTAVFEANKALLYSKNDYFSENMHVEFINGTFGKNEHVYGKHYSAKKWLEYMNLI